ncbi:hypothetical protein AKJ09_05744 [Labilithrix luteola]|uniref:Uncharacterized protein n=1 Tax=Labilithrix luteola TaxID=1391654 RepID=A0A0K1PZW9_9BACT|nr:hypothetical protein AKJ09_05744 [Labilithrix luteola]
MQNDAAPGGRQFVPSGRLLVVGDGAYWEYGGVENEGASR